PEPQVLVAIEADAEDTGWRRLLEQRDLVLDHLSRARVELAEDLFAEACVPRRAGGIDDDVVRLPRALRQVVLRVDDLRRRAGRQREGPHRRRPAWHPDTGA